MAEAGEVVRKSEEDQVEILVLKHPPVNALSTSVLERLGQRLDEIGDSARAIVVTGDGQYFSAGADLKEVASVGVEHAPEVIARTHALFDRLERNRAPVLAAINGLALGGGLELALSCDLRVAGESAKLGAPEVGIGLTPVYGGTQRLPRLIGPAKARELVFTGGMIPAAEALRIGLVNKVVPSGQELRAARDLAHTIATKAPKAVAAAKEAMRRGAELAMPEGLRLEQELFLNEVLTSEDLGEGLAAFVGRRTPKFTGK